MEWSLLNGDKAGTYALPPRMLSRAQVYQRDEDPKKRSRQKRKVIPFRQRAGQLIPPTFIVFYRVHTLRHLNPLPNLVGALRHLTDLVRRCASLFM